MVPQRLGLIAALDVCSALSSPGIHLCGDVVHSLLPQACLSRSFANALLILTLFHLPCSPGPFLHSIQCLEAQGKGWGEVIAGSVALLPAQLFS